jgi:TonB family protein
VNISDVCIETRSHNYISGLQVRACAVVRQAGTRELFIAGCCLLAHAGCSVSKPTPIEAGPQATVPPPWDTPLRLNPSHPPHIGQAYYPKEALAAGEQGRCLMAVIVEPDGSVSSSRLIQSSGSARLDAACAVAFAPDVRFIAATKNGTPVRVSVTIPITWCIDCGHQ